MRNFQPAPVTFLLLGLLTLALGPGPSRAATRDLYSDTWVATDALGRTLPTQKETGPPRPNKTVGMFYFLTFDGGGDGPYDNTQILKAHPEALNDVHHPAWGPLNSSHHWGEPLFGYYASDDEYVLRKHAHMLANAGVDVVIFDNSNAVTYDRARDALCRVWEDIRRHGGKTPQIAFLCPFGNPDDIGGRTLRTLYDTLYAPGLYRDLWFRWRGKPLILADPSYADPEGLRETPHVPAELPHGGSLGQTFTASHPFTAVGGEFPTWNTAYSGMTLSLYGKGRRRRLRLLARRTFANVADNATVLLDVGKPLPPGQYDLEMSQPVGHVGWWSYASDVYSEGRALEDGVPTGGDRALHIRYADKTEAETLAPNARQMAPEAAARLSDTLRRFFTFRTPIPEYNNPSPPPNHWAWLQIHPQAPQRDDAGHVEEVTVGVAQNYNATVDRTAPMSVPGAFGRSYHGGRRDTRPGAVNWGFNFTEQWDQALRIDPPFVFITGWNEWTAGFYDSWAGFHAPPAIFVDQFTQEYSRDIEPMRGGHGDNYYYQLVANVRRYKGVRALPPVVPRPISLDGQFNDWKSVQPEFRDAEGDPARRRHVGFGKAGPYQNATGRNDILTSKVSYDLANVYFYVQTKAPLTAPTGPSWMTLFLNTDGIAKTGWLGYDFIVNRLSPRNGKAFVERCVGSGFRWTTPVAVPIRFRGNELELAIPRRALGLPPTPPAIDFKWADNCLQKNDWTDFTLNGDAAPDDRFNYRAKMSR